MQPLRCYTAWWTLAVSALSLYGTHATARWRRIFSSINTTGTTAHSPPWAQACRPLARSRIPCRTPSPTAQKGEHWPQSFFVPAKEAVKWAVIDYFGFPALLSVYSLAAHCTSTPLFCDTGFLYNSPLTRKLSKNSFFFKYSGSVLPSLPCSVFACTVLDKGFPSLIDAVSVQDREWLTVQPKTECVLFNHDMRVAMRKSGLPFHL